MERIYGFDCIPKIRHAVATVGSYDGLHSGHKVLLEQVIARAKARGGESVVITFEPHPRITLGKAEGLKLLTTLEEKTLLLEQFGIDYMVIIPFDITFSQLSHEQFIEEYLIGKLGIEEMVVGYNHHFGHNKSGDYSYLANQNKTIAVTQVEQQRVESAKVSSTVVRATIESGNISEAVHLLGHTYIIIGQSDKQGFVATDKYKLLPPAATYRAIINGVEESVEVVDGGIYTSQKGETITVELL